MRCLFRTVHFSSPFGGLSAFGDSFVDESRQNVKNFFREFFR
jgi:hypothetical protein